jgi:hypothetical protein
MNHHGNIEINAEIQKTEKGQKKLFKDESFELSPGLLHFPVTQRGFISWSRSGFIVK